MKTSLLFLALAGLTLPAAAIDIAAAGSTYNQTFDTLASSGTDLAWANDSTLPGWSLFRQPSPGTAITTYSAGTGSSSAGTFNSFGSTGSTERALGGTGAGTTYFGSPATGAVAGWIASSFTNKSGAALDGFNTTWDGEQWRNANTSAHTMVFEYGFGSSFTAVAAWNAPGAAFDFTSPVIGSTAGAVAGLFSGLGGTISGLSWADNETLWLRWVEINDTGNDHGLAIDNFTFTATGPSSAAVPEGGMTVAMLGLSMAGMAALRRRLGWCLPDIS